MVCLSKPLVVIVGISKYDKEDDLVGVAADVENLKRFCALYRYTDILANSNGRVKNRNDFLFNILARARGIIDANQRNDGILFFYSGNNPVTLYLENACGC